MKIKGTLTSVVLQPTVTSKDGTKEWDKAVCVIAFPSDDGSRMENVLFTVLMDVSKRGEIGAWENIAMGWTQPVQVEAVLGFRVREYGDRQYMDVSCYNLKFA